jgi:signal peptidase I
VIIPEDIEMRDVQPPNKRPRSTRRHLTEWIVVLVIALLASFTIRAYAFQVFRVPSGSMLPTLQINDRIVVDELPGLAHSITDNATPILVKRVIGLPGETISSKGDTVYINGHAIAEPWLAAMNSAGCWEPAFNIPTTHIPANHYYVMGDCRSDSYDSRYWGTVPLTNVIGRVFVVIWRHNHPWFHWF